MQRASRTQVYGFHSRHNLPQFMVRPGEEFLAETELCTGGWLNSPEDTWAPEKRTGCNPTVVVAVGGAKPGDLLAVDVLEVEPDALGYTGFDAQSNPLCDKIHVMDWGLNTKTVRIKDGFVLWSDTLSIPIDPMIGTIGTAPAEETLSNAKAGLHGGNMDVQEVRPGCTVYLPVETPGGLLHIGDVHAVQGDGEINCAGGIECRSVVRLRVNIVPRPPEYACVRIEDAEYIMTVVSGRSLEESFYRAAEQLLLWIKHDYDIPKREAFLLMGQVMQARNTQFVNPTWSYICKMPKRYLEMASTRNK